MNPQIAQMPQILKTLLQRRLIAWKCFCVICVNLWTNPLFFELMP